MYRIKQIKRILLLFFAVFMVAGCEFSVSASSESNNIQNDNITYINLSDPKTVAGIYNLETITTKSEKYQTVKKVSGEFRINYDTYKNETLIWFSFWDKDILIKRNSDINDELKHLEISNVGDKKMSIKINGDEYPELKNKDGTAIMLTKISNLSFNTGLGIPMPPDTTPDPNPTPNPDPTPNPNPTPNPDPTPTPSPDKIPVTGVIVVPKEKTLYLETSETFSITPSIQPPNATNKKAYFKSDNNTVARVTETGKVTAHKVGKAEIKVTTDDGGFQDICLVTVEKTSSKEIPVTGIKFKDTSDMTVEFAKEKVIVSPNVIISPNDATNRSLEYSSSDMNIADVSDSGAITLKKPGKANITVTSVDGNFKSSFKLISHIYPDEIIVEDSISVAVGGKPYVIDYTFEPTNTTDRSVTFSSDNKSIANVNHGGEVSGVSSGQTKIRMNAANNLEAEISIDVYSFPNMSDLQTINGTYNVTGFKIKDHTSPILELKGEASAKVSEDGLSVDFTLKYQFENDELNFGNCKDSQFGYITKNIIPAISDNGELSTDNKNLIFKYQLESTGFGCDEINIVVEMEKEKGVVNVIEKSPAYFCTDSKGLEIDYLPSDVSCEE